MSSRATSEAPISPPPRSPIISHSKPHIDRRSPPPPIVPLTNGKDSKSLAAVAAALASTPSSTSSGSNNNISSSNSAPLSPPRLRLSSPPPPSSLPPLHPHPLAASPSSTPLISSDVNNIKPSVSAAEKKLDSYDPDVDSPKGEVVDMETFEQILDLDEDEACEFSYGMVVAYFTQANVTFKEMDDALKAQDLGKLSDKGHFLKGSSAALGVDRVKKTCELIQNLGKLEYKGRTVSRSDALELLRSSLARVKKEYKEAEDWLKNYYAEKGVGDAE